MGNVEKKWGDSYLVDDIKRQKFINEYYNEVDVLATKYYPWKHQGWSEKSKLVIVDDVETDEPMTPEMKEKLLKWYSKDILKNWVSTLKEDGDQMIASKFYRDIVKSLGLEEDRVKDIKLEMTEWAAPRVTVTIELNQSQVNALHWIDEQGD